VNDEPLVTREELAAALFALHDILEEVRKIRRFLSGEEEEDVGE
jgi:hypothetical protein